MIPQSAVEILVESPVLAVDEGNSADIRVRLASVPTVDVVVTATWASALIDIPVPFVTFTPENWREYQSIAAAAVVDTDAVGGTVDVQLIATGGSDHEATVQLTVTDVSLFILTKDSRSITYRITAVQISVSANRCNLHVTRIADVNADADIEIGDGDASFAFSLQGGGGDDTFTLTYDDVRPPGPEGNPGGWAIVVTLGPPTVTIDDPTWRQALDAALISVNFVDADGNDRRAQHTRIGASPDVTVIPQRIPEPDIQVEDSTLTVDEGGTVSLRVRLTRQPASNVTVTATEVDTDISVSPETRLFTPVNWATYQTFTVTGTEDADAVDDSALIMLEATGGSSDIATVAVTIIDPDIPIPTRCQALSISFSGTGPFTAHFSWGPPANAVRRDGDPLRSVPAEQRVRPRQYSHRSRYQHDVQHWKAGELRE